MPRENLFRAFLSVLFLFLFLITAVSSFAQRQPQITSPVDSASRAVISHPHPALKKAVDLGALDENKTLDRLILVMKMAPAQQHALSILLDSQQTKGSPNYHQWLTPEEFGRQFGPLPEDLAKITSWLTQEGFSVGKVARSGMWIEFSGTVGQANRIFQTQMRSYQIDGGNHIANATDISVPSALTFGIAGVSLHDFFSRPMFVRSSALPDISNSSGVHAVVPGDFAKIYDLAPLHSANLNGQGQAIALPELSNINLSDVATFQRIFGLPSNAPNIVLNGVDPGVDTFTGLGGEATLDAEWASAVAPGAQIDVVVSQPTSIATDPIQLSASFVVDQNLASIVSLSFGNCEQNLRVAGNTFWNNLWQQAAAQGMSVFVSSGDSGAAGCDRQGLDFNGGAINGVGVNGLASTPFNTAVGGTQFDETVNGGLPATFWSATNAPNFTSALGYIPEKVWNESCTFCAGPFGTSESVLAAGGGGVSTLYPAPSWQKLNIQGLQVLTSFTLPNQTGNVPPRGLPDVSLAAASQHDGFLFCFTSAPAHPDCQLLPDGTFGPATFQNEAGGTSFSAPAFAGIMAIVNQKLAQGASPSPNPVAGARQGLANYVLYSLAAAESSSFSACNSSNRTNPATPPLPACVFNDITRGTIGVPGNDVTNFPNAGDLGYPTALGYDLSTGLGSVDANALVTNWNSAAASFHGSQSALATSPASASISIPHGQPVTFDVQVQKLGGDAATQSPTGSVSLVVQGQGVASDGFNASATLTGSPADTGNFTVSSLPGGSYNLVAVYPGDGFFAGSTSNPIPVTVTPENGTTTLFGPTATSYGRIFELNTIVAGTSGNGVPSGQVTLTDNGTPLGQVPLNNVGSAIFLNCPPNGGTILGAFVSPIPCLSVGTHTITATYSGDAGFAPSPNPPAPSQTITFTVAKGRAVAFLALDPLVQVVLGTPVALTVTVKPPSSASAVPTGTVQLFDGTTALGPPMTLSGTPPQASTSVTLPQGSHTLQAQYSGDDNYASSSANNFFRMGVPFGYQVASTSQTINPGQTATYNFSVVASSGFTGPVTFTCVPASTPVPPGVVCNAPAAVNFTATATSIPVVVTVTTTTQSFTPWSPLGFSARRVTPLLFAALLIFAVILVLSARSTRRVRFGVPAFLSLAILLALTLQSCGGGSTPKGPPPPPPANVTFTVTGTTPINANTTVFESFTLNLAINP